MSYLGCCNLSVSTVRVIVESGHSVGKPQYISLNKYSSKCKNMTLCKGPIRQTQISFFEFSFYTGFCVLLTMLTFAVLYYCVRHRRLPCNFTQPCVVCFILVITTSCELRVVCSGYKYIQPSLL